MSSKPDSRKKGGESSENTKLLSDIETISKALYVDKTVSRLASSTASSRSKSVGKLPESKVKAKDAKNNTKDLSEKDKKSSIWSWKGLKSLTNSRNRKFNCCFSLLVHSIEGLPALFDDICLVVHWKRRDGEQTTRPIRVSQGVAEFEEQLTHSCSVYGSRSGPHHSAKYEAKHFLLFASVYDDPELDLGKHRVDLTRLLPLTLEELEEEKSSGKWTTSFRLSGKARGATLNVSFGYVVIGNNGSELSGNNNIIEISTVHQNGSRTAKLGGHFNGRDEPSIPRSGSLPARSTISNRSIEDIKDLHEVFPVSKSELCDSVNIVYKKLEEEESNASNEKKSDVGPLSSSIEEHQVNSLTPSDAGGKQCQTDIENSEFSVIDKGIEEFTKEQVKSEDDVLKVTKGPEEGLETEAAVKIPVVEDALLHLSAGESLSHKDEQSMSTCNKEKENDADSEESLEELTKEQVKSEDESLKVAQGLGENPETDSALKFLVVEDALVHHSAEESLLIEQSTSTCNYIETENDANTTESLMKELEHALSCASDLVCEEIDSQDESDALQQENYLEMKSSYKDSRNAKSLCLDDVTDAVASEFLDMLGIEHSPFGISSESDPESPRERLLRQFEKDALASGGFLNFEIDNDPIGHIGEIPMESVCGTTSEDLYHSSMYKSFEQMATIETDASMTKTRASKMADLETEALMREWGLNEKAFQHSPPSSSGGFGSPIDILPEDPQQLPPISEGLGPFVQTENGGFLRSMNPTLFRNAKSGGSLIMQVSNPVVVPAEIGSGVMDILQGLASVGIEKLSMQANKLMPLEDISGKKIQQLAWEAAPSLERLERQDTLHHETEVMQNKSSKQKSGKGTPSGPRSSKSGSTPLSKDREYVSLEDLAPLAMDKIEALSIEGLRIQSGMSNDEAPSNISTQSIGELSALKGKTVGVGGSIGLDGTGGLQLLDIKDNGEDVDGLMGLSLTLDEWMKLDSGEIDDDDLIDERTSKILAAHHATSLDMFRGRSKGEKRRGKGRKYGLLGNNFTVALMVQLRDPMRDYEPVGSPMLALIQVERVFIPPKPKIHSTVSLVGKFNEEEEETGTPKEEDTIEKPKEEKNIEESIPQYKITEVHVAGLKTEPGRKKLWGSSNQQQSGSRWLLANGMGKKNKHPAMKSKPVARPSGPGSSTTVQPGDTLWSISSRVLGTGAKWKQLAALNPHIRNPNLILPPNETIRLR